MEIDDYEQYSYYDYDNYDKFAGEYFDSGMVDLFSRRESASVSWPICNLCLNVVYFFVFVQKDLADWRIVWISLTIKPMKDALKKKLC